MAEAKKAKAEKATGKSAKPMTKTQLTQVLAEATSLPKKTIAMVFDELLKIAYREAKKEAGFVFPGVGKLVITKSKARTGRHPQTGAPIKIAAKRRLKFRIAKPAKDAVLGK
jgi:DNA-binding protein HU-beta